MNEFPGISGGITVGILEDVLEDCKASILETLVVDGLLTKEDADKWCKFHTIVVSNRSDEHFRSFTSRDYGIGHPDESIGESGKIRLCVVSSHPFKSDEEKKKIRE